VQIYDEGDGQVDVIYMGTNYVSMPTDAPTYEPEYVGIHLGDGFDEILQKLGITEEGAQYLKELNAGLMHLIISEHIQIDAEQSRSYIAITCDWNNSAGWCEITMIFDENDHLSSFNIRTIYYEE